MRCPRCKKNIAPESLSASLRCPHCETRAAVQCKNCKSINSIMDFTCASCGIELLKRCPSCGGINLAQSEMCRRCGASFEAEIPQQVQNDVPEEVQPQDPLQDFIAAVQDPEKRIITITGQGAKNNVFKPALEQLQYAWVYGKCTPLTQLTPGGLIQDILINVLGLSNFCVYNKRFEKDAFKFFRLSFPGLSKDEVHAAINFLYPTHIGKEIFSRKQRTFGLLGKIFDRLTLQENLIFAIDNFDHIDGFSYEFFNIYMQNEQILNRVKIVAIAKEETNVLSFYPGVNIRAAVPETVPEALPEEWRQVLAAAAIMEEKINFALIGGVFDIAPEKLQKCVEELEAAGFVIPLNNVFYEFTNTAVYEKVLELSAQYADFEEIKQKIYEFLSNFTLSSYAVLSFSRAFDWNKNAALAAAVGDVYAYTQSRKRWVEDGALDSDERCEVYAELGMLLSVSNPEEAMDYLQEALSQVKDSAAEIELLAYVASCCRAVGYYHGEIECVDKVLKKISPERKLDIALTKATKLPALVNAGCCGQAVNLIDNEIMPVFNEYFNKKHYDANKMFVFEIWMKTYLILANAMVLQGNERAFEVLAIVADIIDRYKIKNPLFICKYQIMLAAAHTMKGEIDKSNEIILSTMESAMDSEIILRRSLITVINRFLKKEYDNLQEQMCEIVMYAGNAGDSFTKNILKVLLGKLFEARGDKVEALRIYNEQIEYFAKEKQAIGALLSWFLIAEADPENAVEISIKALEVAKSPQIDNYIFADLFNKKLINL